MSFREDSPFDTYADVDPDSMSNDEIINVIESLEYAGEPVPLHISAAAVERGLWVA